MKPLSKIHFIYQFKSNIPTAPAGSVSVTVKRQIISALTGGSEKYRTTLSGR